MLVDQTWGTSEVLVDRTWGDIRGASRPDMGNIRGAGRPDMGDIREITVITTRHCNIVTTSPYTTFTVSATHQAQTLQHCHHLTIYNIHSVSNTPGTDTATLSPPHYIQHSHCQQHTKQHLTSARNAKDSDIATLLPSQHITVPPPHPSDSNNHP
ncbi:hypothetical protein Btru_040763 [Bulinus truncatus]|nr:hypothetical protein Btru_040763 [Bulinus truncatus]